MNSMQSTDWPQVDLLSLVGSATCLRRISGTRGGEYAGPCPQCGGRDRFHMQPAHGLWSCRKCSPRWRGAVAFVMWQERCSFGTAMERLQGGTMIARRVQEVEEIDPFPTPELEATWHEVADTCHRQLVGAARPLAYLHGRAITDAMIDVWQIGYNPGRPGETTAIAGMRVPCGITIPLWAIDGHLYGVSVRRAAAPKGWDGMRDWRYQEVYRTRKPLFGRASANPVLVIVEGWLDAILLHAHAGDLADSVAVGSTSSTVHQRFWPFLMEHREWLISYDNDDPGRKGAQGWLWSERSRLLPVPEGKDATDFVKAGGDLRAWLKEVG